MAEGGEDLHQQVNGTLTQGSSKMSEDNRGLPLTPAGEVTLSQSTWERLDKEGYRMGMRHQEEEAASQHGTYRREDMKTDAPGQVTVEGVYHPLGAYSDPFLGLRRHLPDRVQPSSYPSRLSVEDPLRRLDSHSGGCSGNAPHQQIGAGGDGHRPNLKPQP